MTGSYTDKYARALSKLGTLPPDAPQGVLDIGSNSVRLVGYSGSARTPLPIYNERAFCRLGDAVAASGAIDGAPRDKALETFRRFRAIAEQLGIENLAVFATAAVREAKNSAAFVAEAEQCLGAKIRVLSDEEEALFSADGVMLGVPGADGIVADLGGGSLELARVREGQVQQWASLPLGVLALERASGNDLSVMAGLIETELARLDWLQDGRDLPIYIVGGTWRAMAKLHMKIIAYPLEVLHQYEMNPADIEGFCTRLTAQGAAAEPLLAQAPGNRRKDFPAAALVLKTLMAQGQPNKLVVSANAVREGILYAELKAKYRSLDPLLMACEEMASRLCKAEAYGHELAIWTDGLYRHAAPEALPLEEINRLREAACLISDLAWSSHSSFRAATVRQTVLTAPFAGISHKARVFMADALSFRHEVRETELDLGDLKLSAKDDALARALGLSLRLAHSLSASLPGALPQTKLKAGRHKLTLTLSPALQNLNAPIIEKRLAAVAKALGLAPVLEFGDVETD
ncbi:MAG: Ppx/GppA family phosphatase [Rhodobiaceae bacterium]|jgi:exopolyphosphatase/guanosine-5'-triphosphate,3'-diphosphate pyrophosphatase|nr:Ppx/GppA family phosphatase [Rhodobiaceae bacterium]MBT7279127.1 Ppx/GppA family phosphatase [Rhodobiaceae bacterium]